uniref:Salt tolerance-like protein n=1 Tax=Aegilops tauschii TaxID=37682 RepID=M8D4W8_AEGTA
MKIQCDSCGVAAATVVCCADEAALCARCDVEIHAANKLASKHQRLPLDALGAQLPRCDIRQEKAAFIFRVEDRALFCRDCDEPIHVPGTLSGNHQRYLATGIRVGLGPDWAVDELLQFSDYESNDKLHKDSPLAFKELEWFTADMELFHDHAPKGGRATMEVPEFFASQAADDAAYYRPSRVAATAGLRQSKKARVEIPDDEDFFIVPDLG